VENKLGCPQSMRAIEAFFRAYVYAKPLSKAGAPTIFITSSMHLSQAFVIAKDPNAVGATYTLGILKAIQSLFHVSDHAGAVVGAMVVVALLALSGITLRLGKIRLAMLLPQHLLLGAMAIGGLAAIWQGAYLDGTLIDRGHIYVDQIVCTALWWAHSYAILGRARDD